MRYTLMNQGREVLDFAMDANSGLPTDIRPREGMGWAPMQFPTDGQDLVPSLDRFLRQRAICVDREDLASIMRACGTRRAVDLALQSGGFSLSDQYWYRHEGTNQTWEGSNFFDNEWDPSFGEAILKKDYDALAHASARTPDTTLGGFCRKAWIQTERGPRLHKATCADDANILCEALVSRMLDRLVGMRGHVPYQPATFCGELYSTSPVMLGKDEELVRGIELLGREGVALERLDAATGMRNFDELMGIYLRALQKHGVPEPRQAVAKVFVTATLTLDFDTHPSNFGFIRNLKTLELREAPLFDHGRGFTYMRDKFALIKREPRVAELLLGLHFCRLDPAWDYSWYDPHALDDFEDEILETLSAIDALPKGYAELMVALFKKQRSYVNRIAERSR